MVKEISKAERKKIRRILRKRVKTSPRAIRKFGVFTGDTNEIHFRKECAQAHGLKNVPVMGAHQSAIGLERALELYEMHTGTACPPQIYHHTKFSNHLYPGRKWLGPLEMEEDNGETVIKLPIHRRNIVCSANETRIGLISRTLKPFGTPDAGPVYADIILTPEGESKYRRLLKSSKRESVSPGWIQALLPGVLVRILAEAYRGEPAKPTPFNRAMTTVFYDKIALGAIRVEAHAREERTTINGSIYMFSGRIYQGNNLVAETELKALSDKPLSMENIRKVKDIQPITL